MFWAQPPIFAIPKNAPAVPVDGTRGAISTRARETDEGSHISPPPPHTSAHSTSSLCAGLMRWVFTMQRAVLLLPSSLSAAAAAAAVNAKNRRAHLEQTRQARLHTHILISQFAACFSRLLPHFSDFCSALLWLQPSPNFRDS